MKNRINLHHTLTLVFSIISFFCLVFIILQVNTNLHEILNIESVRFTLLVYTLGFGHLFFLLFNIYAIVILFIHFRNNDKLPVLKTAILITGIISLFSMGVEKVMIDEIARQYRAGMEIREILILNSAYVINLIFTILMLYYSLRTIPVLRTERTGSTGFT